jgi:tripartite-type tricarboxylate transporter receptor subunit TctC
MKNVLLMLFFIANAITAAYANTTADVIKIVVPFAPGGPTDVVTRELQHILNKELKKPVVIEYHSGAGGTIGNTRVINSPPNETVLIVNTLSYIVSTSNHPPPYQINDLVPIVYLGRIPFVLTTSIRSGITNFNQWKNWSNSITSGSGGVGSSTHLVAEYFNQKMPKNLTHVYYRGSGQLINDLLGGHVDSAFLFSTTAIPHIHLGKLNAIAVDSDRRLDSLPDVPTFKELGITNMGNFSWFMLFSNKTNNTEELNKLQQILIKVLNDQTRSASLKSLGLEWNKTEIVPQKTFITNEKDRIFKLVDHTSSN